MNHACVIQALLVLTFSLASSNGVDEEVVVGADGSIHYDKNVGFPDFFDCEAEPVVAAKVPFTYLDQREGVDPFKFASLCPEVQTCIGVRDDLLWNGRLGAMSTAFPVFENALLPDVSPKDGQQVIENAKVLFGDESVLHVAGVGTFTGPTAIGSYLAVPHTKVWGMVETSSASSKFKIVGRNDIVVTTDRIEKWRHRGNQSDHTEWQNEITYYPCSVQIKSMALKLPDSTLDAFVDAALAPNAKENVCQRIQSNCAAEHEQFVNYDECLDYMDALPHIDPICQHKYGPNAVVGNSFMCKFLHQFMTPYQPELHCYHSGKGRFDTSGVRKCTPLDCLDERTPQKLQPSLIFPPNEVTAETTFEHIGNGTFVETLVQPEVAVSDKGMSDSICSDDDLESLAAASLLALPYCMPSLGVGACLANCTQAVHTFLGTFSENGTLCRCSASRQDTRIVDKSSLLQKVDVDARALVEFCSDTLLSFQLPSCVDAWYVQKCPDTSTYRGRNSCLKFSLPDIVQKVQRDWREGATISGRTTKTDLLATIESFLILDYWRTNSKSRELYYNGGSSLLPIPEDAATFTKIHPSMGAAELRHEHVLRFLRLNQNRSRAAMNVHGGTDAILPKLSGARLRNTTAHGETYLLPPISYGDGQEMHKKTRDLILEMLPGMYGGDYALQDIMQGVMQLRNLTANDLRNNLDADDVESLVVEAVFRALLNDQLPYINDKLGDDLESLRARLYFRAKEIHELGGNLWPTSFLASSYQIRRLLQDSQVLSVESMERILTKVGLADFVAADGSHGAYGLLAMSLLNLENMSVFFRKLVKRVQFDECKIKHYWDEAGATNFVMEHLRLVMRTIIISSTESDPVERIYYLGAANRDENVFSDPHTFNPQRANLHQMMVFNGLEQDFHKYADANGYVNETGMREAPSLKRYCPGRHVSMKAFTELAPLFFPPRTSEYHCHGGMRAWYGVKFESSLIHVRDGVDLEVLQVDGSSDGDQLMIFLHDTIDVPVGWARFIHHLRKKRNRFGKADMDFWSLVMPGFGARATPLRACEWPRLGDYVGDLLRIAKKSYKRVYLFGRGDGGYIAYYAAHKVGKHILYGFITDVMPPAVYAAHTMSKPIVKFPRAQWLDPVSDIVLVSSAHLLEKGLENSTWWNQAWEWEFRSFQKKTGARQIACQTRSNWAVGANLHPTFSDFDQAKSLDPAMHMLTISHEFSLLHPDRLMRAGSTQTSPRRGTVQSFEQVREKPGDMLSQYYEDEPAEELADLVSRFVDRTLRIRHTFASLATFPPEFEDSAYEDDSSGFMSSFYVYILTIIIMITGIIMELTIGPMLVKAQNQALWLFAQVMGAALFIGCMFAADAITIPFWILGFFKFGYPEITTSLVGPLLEPDSYFNSTVVRVASFFSGVAYIVHHTGGTIAYSVVTFHLMDPSTVALVSLPLAFQHLSVFLKYTKWKYSNYSYTCVVLGLEVWFQLEAVYLLTYAVDEAVVALYLCLTSHYIWFVHGCIVLCYEIMENRKHGSPSTGETRTKRSQSLAVFEKVVGVDGSSSVAFWMRQTLRSNLRRPRDNVGAFEGTTLVTKGGNGRINNGYKGSTCDESGIMAAQGEDASFGNFLPDSLLDKEESSLGHGHSSKVTFQHVDDSPPDVGANVEDV